MERGMEKRVNEEIWERSIDTKLFKGPYGNLIYRILLNIYICKKNLDGVAK